MKFYTTVQTTKFAWDQVASSFWKRYPNPWSKHVLSEDVVVRNVEEGKLKSTRFIVKTNRVPKWGERFISNSVACVVEETIVDPIARRIITYTRNITFQKLMVVEEKCVYEPCQQNTNHTSITKQAWISSGVYGLAGRAIEKLGVERFKQNAVKANKGLDYILEKIFAPDKTLPINSLKLPHPQKHSLQ